MELALPWRGTQKSANSPPVGGEDVIPMTFFGSVKDPNTTGYNGGDWWCSGP